MSGIKIISSIIVIVAVITSCNKETLKPDQLNCRYESDTFHTSDKSQFYESLISQYTSKDLPGISLLIKDSTGIFIGSSGVADIENQIALQPCHITHFSGVTQMLTAAAIFKLHEKGSLSVDDPISKYISKDILKKIENGENDIKIRNLLNHTTGFCDFFNNNDFFIALINNPTGQQTPEELLKYVYNKPSMFSFRPHDTVGFSNTNYLFLSMVIESATGVPSAKVINDEIILPLGMTDTYFSPFQNPPSSQTAIGYYDLHGDKSLHNLSHWNTGFGNGFNGIYSTVWDMNLFLNALLIDKTLLNNETLNLMLTFEPDIERGKQMGMGCFRDFVDYSQSENFYSWGYRGNDLAYTAELHYFPELKTSLVVAVNYGTLKNSTLLNRYREFRGKLAFIIRNQ
ncbi:MAG: beta-lactamase family protein [Lentimicrobium sp.]|nr:beta-lactamase family protein [Lentimicrobium sp.]